MRTDAKKTYFNGILKKHSVFTTLLTTCIIITLGYAAIAYGQKLPPVAMKAAAAFIAIIAAVYALYFIAKINSPEIYLADPVMWGVFLATAVCGVYFLTAGVTATQITALAATELFTVSFLIYRLCRFGKSETAHLSVYLNVCIKKFTLLLPILTAAAVTAVYYSLSSAGNIAGLATFFNGNAAATAITAVIGAVFLAYLITAFFFKTVGFIDFLLFTGLSFSICLLAYMCIFGFGFAQIAVCVCAAPIFFLLIMLRSATCRYTENEKKGYFKTLFTKYDMLLSLFLAASGAALTYAVYAFKLATNAPSYGVATEYAIYFIIGGIALAVIISLSAAFRKITNDKVYAGDFLAVTAFIYTAASAVLVGALTDAEIYVSLTFAAGALLSLAAIIIRIIKVNKKRN